MEKGTIQGQELNLFLRSLVLTQDFRNLKKGYKIEFDSPITLLAGENGCGKSSVLDLIRSYYGAKAGSYYKQKEFGKIIEVKGKPLGKDEVGYFDFHSDDKKFDGDFGEDMESQVLAILSSSGQGGLIQFASSGILKRKNSLILLDELGRGFSPRTQYLFCNLLIKSTTKNGNQIIAATHEIPILELSREPFCRIYSMEENKCMDFKEFLKSQIDFSKSPFI